VQQGDEQLGTGVFAQLNIVHVKYRGFFVERFQCCCHPLREVSCSSSCLTVWLEPASSAQTAKMCPTATMNGVLQYVVKPCVRDFGEIPTDHEFDNGEVTLVMDDCNPGTRCLCLPGFYKRLTITAKVKTFLYSAVINSVSACCQCVLLVKRRKAHHITTLKFLHGASDMQAFLLTHELFL